MLAAVVLAGLASAASANCGNLRSTADGRPSDAFVYAKCLVTLPAPDYPLARRYFSRALADGYTSAACPLADMMMSGLGGSTEPAAGIAMCRKAAESGDAESEAQFGGNALQGKGMTRDPILARTMLTAAAKQGHGLAALTVGMIYWNGDGTPKDNGAARIWWQQAYKAGRKEAAVLLGNEAFVRLTAVATPDKADPAVLEEAIDWYQHAQAEDPDPNTQAVVRQRLGFLVSARSIIGRPLPPR